MFTVSTERVRKCDTVHELIQGDMVGRGPIQAIGENWGKGRSRNSVTPS